MSEAGDEMIIDHARTLHHRVAGGGADEGEAELLEGLVISMLDSVVTVMSSIRSL
jgi:hypothetical protein